MLGRTKIFATAAIGISIMAWMNPALAQAPAGSASVKEAAPIPADQIPQNIKDAFASPGRPAADLALDAGRKPDQMVAFFGIAPGMEVGEIFAGGGYTTQLLSVAVGPTGKVYSQNPVFPPERQRIADAFSALHAEVRETVTGRERTLF